MYTAETTKRRPRVHVGKTHNHQSDAAGALVGWDGLGVLRAGRWVATCEVFACVIRVPVVPVNPVCPVCPVCVPAPPGVFLPPGVTTGKQGW